MSRKLSKVFLIIMAVVIMATFLIGSFYQPALQPQSQQVRLPTITEQPQVLGTSASAAQIPAPTP